MSNYNDVRLVLIRLRMMETFLERGDIENAKKVISRMRDSIIYQVRRDGILISRIIADDTMRKVTFEDEES